MSPITTRRQLMEVSGIIGLGAILSQPASAQSKDDIQFKFSARSAGDVHRKQLEELTKILEGKAPTSIEGMARLVDMLERRKLFKRKGTELLKKLLKALAEATAFNALLELVSKLAEEAIDELGDLVVAIMRIARDSITYIKSIGATAMPVHVITRIVAADVQGALLGADVGERLGGARGALLGAIAGAVTASSNAL